MGSEFEIKSERIKGIEPKRFREGGRPHYNVRIFVEADEEEALDSIEKVQYELHPTFRNRTRVSSDRRRKFEVRIWTYGYFDIKATLMFKDAPPRDIDGYVSW